MSTFLNVTMVCGMGYVVGDTGVVKMETWQAEHKYPP